MATPSDTAALITTLNILLANIHLPISLHSPQDLTPSLLIAILESTLKSRLPIPVHIRQSQSFSEKIHATKIFLGVLEHDILQTDVGLSDVDPRKLALGEWDEVVFVGELLCWLGKKRGILPPETVETLRDIEDSSVLPTMRRRGALSPSTRSTVTDSANTDLSMQSAQLNNSDTTVMTDSYSSMSSPVSSRVVYPTMAAATPRRPRCIHELDEPSAIVFDDDDNQNESCRDIDASITADSDDQSYCACSARRSSSSQHTRTPVRYTGWIDAVDNSLELESFESSRKISARNQNQPVSSGSESRSKFTGWPYQLPVTYSPPKTPSLPPTTNRIITKHTSPSEHTLALLNERARLLAELAKLRAPPD